MCGEQLRVTEPCREEEGASTAPPPPAASLKHSTGEQDPQIGPFLGLVLGPVALSSLWGVSAPSSAQQNMDHGPGTP